MTGMLLSAFPFLFFASLVGSTTRRITNSPAFETVRSTEEETWRRQAINILWAERRHWGHTPLVRVPLAGFPNVNLFLKNESATATGSLKHRFAWSLMFWGVIEGKITASTQVVEGSSGNTAAGLAYLCGLLNVSFTAVMSSSMENEKREHVRTFGGRILAVPIENRFREAARLGAKPGHFLVNQHPNAQKAIDSFESGNFSFESANLFHEIYVQLKSKAPDYFIHAAGTGGTITSVGRYVHRYNLPTRIVLANSEFSQLYDYAKSGHLTPSAEGRQTKRHDAPSIPGINNGIITKSDLSFGISTSFRPSIIDEVARMPNVATTTAVRVLQRLQTNTGSAVNGGPSSALNFLVALAYAHRHKGTPTKHTTITSLICDPGLNYRSTFLNNTWISEKLDGGVPRMRCWEKAIEKAIASGEDFLELGKNC